MWRASPAQCVVIAPHMALFGALPGPCIVLDSKDFNDLSIKSTVVVQCRLTRNAGSVIGVILAHTNLTSGVIQMVKKLVSTCVVVLAATLAMSPAFAQIEEIIVTASKRVQTLQEVPIAVSVVTADMMEKAQINDILELQSIVPSLRVVQLQNSGQTNFLIRGFGNGANNPGIEPSVGVFIDGVYRSRSASALADLPYLERIEVLRGPQSTLFGKNASAGVISVITAAPNMDGLGGSATVTYGNYNQVIVKGSIDGPLSDTFGFSLGATVNQRDGYFDNLESGNDINARDRSNKTPLDIARESDHRALAAVAEILVRRGAKTSAELGAGDD